VISCYSLASRENGQETGREAKKTGDSGTQGVSLCSLRQQKGGVLDAGEELGKSFGEREAPEKVYLNHGS